MSKFLDWLRGINSSENKIPEVQSEPIIVPTAQDVQMDEMFQDLKSPVTVNFKPNDICLPKYLFQDTLGKGEAEEMAARCVEFWQLNDDWKAVNYKAVAELMDKQFNIVCKNSNCGIYSLMILDAWRIMPGVDSDVPNVFLSGINYLRQHEYIIIQDEKFIAPTDKLLNAISKFVQVHE